MTFCCTTEVLYFYHVSPRCAIVALVSAGSFDVEVSSISLIRFAMSLSSLSMLWFDQHVASMVNPKHRFMLLNSRLL